MANVGQNELRIDQACSKVQPRWESNLLPFTVSTLTVRVSVDFLHFVLHSIYILDCYQILTRFDLIFFIVPVMN